MEKIVFASPKLDPAIPFFLPSRGCESDPGSAVLFILGIPIMVVAVGFAFKRAANRFTPNSNLDITLALACVVSANMQRLRLAA